MLWRTKVSTVRPGPNPNNTPQSKPSPVVLNSSVALYRVDINISISSNTWWAIENVQQKIDDAASVNGKCYRQEGRNKEGGTGLKLSKEAERVQTIPKEQSNRRSELIAGKVKKTLPSDFEEVKGVDGGTGRGSVAGEDRGDGVACGGMQIGVDRREEQALKSNREGSEKGGGKSWVGSLVWVVDPVHCRKAPRDLPTPKNPKLAIIQPSFRHSPPSSAVSRSVRVGQATKRRGQIRVRLTYLSF
ncbi:hypothetical protein LXL04_023149 [Taraxacum kok-saghyz]